MSGPNPSRPTLDESPERPPPLVSVCLLLYNSERYVDDCLDALATTRYAPWELIVVDNGCRDHSVARVRERLGGWPTTVPAQVVVAGGNRGYAGGMNFGARAARGEYLAFLGATVTVEPDWLGAVEWLSDHPDVGFAQPPILDRTPPHRIEALGSCLDPDGHVRVIGERGFLIEDDSTEPYVRDVWGVQGSAFIARRRAFEAVGGFDERLFLYFEESDLAWRGWLRGFRTVLFHVPARHDAAYHQFHGTAPAVPEVEYLFRRNRTVAMARNLETRNLIYLLPNLAYSAGELARYPRKLAKYGLAVAVRLPDALAGRAAIQRDRQRSDQELFAIRPPEDLARIVRDFEPIPPTLHYPWEFRRPTASAGPGPARRP